MDKGKKINWKNGLLFSAVSYLLYIIIWLVLDYETARQLPEMALIDYMVDFLLCMLFTYTSLGFCYIVFNVFPFKASYVRVIVYASCLLMLNNLVAFGMISLFNFLWSGTGETSHTRKVFNPYKIVKRRKPTHRAFFILCQNLLPAIYQCTSPPVWKSIRKASENILAESRVLLTRIIVQIITKKQTTIVLQPLITITKSIAVRATK